MPRAVDRMGIRMLRSEMRDYGMGDELKLADDMAHGMLKKLFENRHKTHWNGCTQKWLLKRLRQETEELRRAVEKGCPDKIAREAADVANFAAMIADNARSS